MTFSDVFKSSFLEKVTSFSVFDMAIALIISFVLGLFIFFVYKKTFCGVMYSMSFGISLVAMSLITTLIILAVTSNVYTIPWYGRCVVYRSFQKCNKRTSWYCLLFWFNICGNSYRCWTNSLAVFGSILSELIMVIFVNKKSQIIRIYL